MKHLGGQSIDIGGNGTNKVDSSISIVWESTSPARVVQFLIFLSENCFNFLTSRWIQDEMIVSTSLARPERCLCRYVAILWSLVREVPEVACLDLLINFALSIVNNFFFA